MSEPHRSISQIYKGLDGLGQKAQIDEATKFVKDAGQVDRAFAEESRRFESFLANEPFFPAGTRKPLPESTLASGVRTTAEFASLLWRPPVWEVIEHPSLNFRYVDREIVTSRATTSGGSDPLSMDLLLANAADRTPIAGELKLAGDQNAFYALIQGLVHAARLTTPNQLKRLRRFYADQFATERPQEAVDLYLLLRDHPTTGTRPILLEKADDLAARLMAKPSQISRRVRRIACLSAASDAESLVFNSHFVHGDF